MKFYEGNESFPYSWEFVAEAFWKRYPNPYSKHVLSVDVISREVKDGCLFTKRLLRKTNPTPACAKPFVGKLRNVLVVEESIIDTNSKTIVTYTRNFGALSGVMRVDERVEYRAKDSENTSLTRQAWISSAVRGFSSFVTRVGYERFKSNAVKAYNGFMHVLGNMSDTQTTEQPAYLLNSEKLKMLRTETQDKVRETQDKVREKAEKARDKARQFAHKADVGAKEFKDFVPKAKSAT